MGIMLKTKHSINYYLGYIRFNMLRDDIEEYVTENCSDGTKSFLMQSDCEGKLTYKQCKELLFDIQNMEDKGEKYGACIGLEIGTYLTITEFKSLLQNCISHRCNLKWL